jgi:hypothetical protein
MEHVKRNVLEKFDKMGIGIIRRFDAKFEVYSLDTKFVYIRSANAKIMKPSTRKYWYGIPKPVLDKYNRFGKLFILFIMDDGANILLIPATEFITMMRGIEIDIDNRWKPYLYITEDKATFRLKGKVINVTNYLNNLKLISEYAAPEKLVEEITEKPPPTKERELSEIIVEYSTKSELHKEFEFAVLRGFQTVGFDCEWISEGTKSGDTDILAKAPYRIIIDPKTRSDGSLAEINFTRIRRHKESNNAKYVVVVAPGFTPALVKDAEQEKVCLIAARVLREILLLNEDFSVIPADLETIIATSGLVNESKLEHLRERYSQHMCYVSRLIVLIEELKNPQSLDTLYGIIRTRDRYERRSEIDKRELTQILELLSSPPINAVEVVADGRYFRTREVGGVKRRLLSLVRLMEKFMGNKG